MYQEVKIAPSVLSADFSILGQELKSIETADFIHYDVMDGTFVPNISFGPSILKTVKKVTDTPVDCHLMISNPENLIDEFIEAGADIITFHYEATNHPHRLIHHIKDAGVKAGIVLNPATPVCMLEDLIEDVDMVLLMSVNPGFGGQSFIERSVEKTRQLKALCDAHNVSPMIEVDGGISAQNAQRVVEAGANVLVAGSAVFKQADRADAISKIRAAGNLGMGLGA